MYSSLGLAVKAIEERRRKDYLRYYIMQRSNGTTSGQPWEMLETEAEENNRIFSEARSDWRWVCMPEMGRR